MKLFCLAALAAACLCFGACSSTQLTTAQQLFTSDCSVVKADLQALTTSTLLTTAQQTQISKLLTTNKTVCASVASAEVSTLESINNSLLPAAINIVPAIPAIPDQPLILLGLNTLGSIVQQLVDQAISASTGGASSAVPASAPAAAFAAIYASL